MFLKGSLCSWTQIFSCSELNFNTKKYTFLHKKNFLGEKIFTTHMWYSLWDSTRIRDNLQNLWALHIYTLYIASYILPCVLFRLRVVFHDGVKCEFLKSFFDGEKAREKRKEEHSCQASSMSDNNKIQLNCLFPELQLGKLQNFYQKCWKLTHNWVNMFESMIRIFQF
jgi:hypothetical protein